MFKNSTPQSTGKKFRYFFSRLDLRHGAMITTLLFYFISLNFNYEKHLFIKTRLINFYFLSIFDILMNLTKDFVIS